MSGNPIIRVENLTRSFTVKASRMGGKSRELRAVSDVTFDIFPGECLGLVGESGCGKSTLGRLLLRLLKPTHGKIFIDGDEITGASKETLGHFRRQIQAVFQDPFSSLNPRMRVGDIVAEPLRNLKMSKPDIESRVLKVLGDVGLQAQYRDRYPHAFSGGQRQRICIARALAQRPRILICDEAVSALDVSIQAQILNLLNEIRREYNLTILFISHSLGVIRHICHRVAVMYLGQLVELAGNDDLFANPLHPYTRALISAVPEPGNRHRRDRIVLSGEMPNPIDPPAGCYFSTRCPIATEQCRTVMPEFREIEPGRYVRCHRPGEFR